MSQVYISKFPSLPVEAIKSKCVLNARKSNPSTDLHFQLLVRISTPRSTSSLPISYLDLSVTLCPTPTPSMRVLLPDKGRLGSSDSSEGEDDGAEVSGSLDSMVV